MMGQYEYMIAAASAACQDKVLYLYMLYGNSLCSMLCTACHTQLGNPCIMASPTRVCHGNRMMSA